MSRLTKAVKQQIIEKWVNEKWKKRLQQSHKDLRESLTIAAEKQLASEINLYEENKNKSIREYLNTFCLISTYYLDEEIKDCEVVSIFGSNLDIKTYVSKSKHSKSVLDLGLDTVKKPISEYNSAITKFDNERQSIEDVLASVTTIKKLCDILPEIEKYIPETSNCTALVSVSCLVKAKSVL